MVGFVDAEADADGEQVPLRDHVLAGVLHRPDHDDPDRAALGEQQRQGGVDPLLHGAVGDPAGQRGDLIDQQHDQRLVGGGGVEAGDAHQPVGAFAASRATASSSSCGEAGLVAAGCVGVAVGEPVEQRPAERELHAALGVDRPHLHQTRPG